MTSEALDQEQQELILDFVAEAREMLDSTEPMFVMISQLSSPQEIEEMINTIFRLFHSFKGGAGFLNLNSIKELTHVCETVLTSFRKSPLALKETHLELLVGSCDLLRQMIDQVAQESHDRGFEETVHQMIHKLQQSLTAALPIAKEGWGEAPKPAIPEHSPSASAPELPLPHPLEEENWVASLLTPELKQNYVNESEEQIQNAEDNLLVLDKIGNEVDTQEYIETVFRNLHTLKGNSGFLGIAPIEHLSHQAENVLESIKTGSSALSPEAIQLLLQVMDVLRQGVRRIATEQPLDVAAFEHMKGLLEKFLKQPFTPKPSLAYGAKPIGDILIDMGATTPTAVERALRQQQLPIGQLLIEMGEVAPEKVEEALTEQLSSSAKTSGASTTGASATPAGAQRQEIRVNLEKLDQLINLVGELVISTAMIAHHSLSQSEESEDFQRAARQLQKNTRDLQEVAMSMRMVPVSSTFRKMVRVVHDVSKKVGKQINLEIVGEETEVDKTLTEQIADPLLHLVRNAVDHGIDTPEERQLAGKPAMGKIRLEAKHAGNEVWISIIDDGRGMNRERILAKAHEKGLIAPEANPPDEEVWKIIFAPGFSTADKVTDVSGRGVGMDVVKRNIEKLGGRIDIYSQAGKGSTFVLRIPLTLAIIDGMLVRVGKARYVLPVGSVREVLQPKPEEITRMMDQSENVMIRQHLYPVLRLHELDQILTEVRELWQGTLIVLEDSERQFCLFVDEVLGQQQIVIKALPDYLARVPHISGCTIMGDGGISLIVDVAHLGQSSLPPYFN